MDKSPEITVRDMVEQFINERVSPDITLQPLSIRDAFDHFKKFCLAAGYNYCSPDEFAELFMGSLHCKPPHRIEAELFGVAIVEPASPGDSGLEGPIPPWILRLVNPNYWDMIKCLGSAHYKADTEPIDLLSSGGMMHDKACGDIIKYAYRNRREYLEFYNKETSETDIEKIIHYALILAVLAGYNPAAIIAKFYTNLTRRGK